MKKIILSIFAVSTIFTANAQGSFGIKAGTNMSNYKIGVKEISLSVNTGNKFGFYLGGVYNYDFNKIVGVQTELTYDFGGAVVRTHDIKGLKIPNLKIQNNLSLRMNTHTLTLPIMARFFPKNDLSVLAGFSLSYRVGLGISADKNTQDMINNNDPEGYDEIKKIGKQILSDNLRGFDLGLTLGLEYKFCNSFFADVRYNLGLVNKIKSPISAKAIDKNIPDMNIKDMYGITPTIKLSSIQFGIGYRF